MSSTVPTLLDAIKMVLNETQWDPSIEEHYFTEPTFINDSIWTPFYNESIPTHIASNGTEPITVTELPLPLPRIYKMTKDDAAWILTATFIIFTMQTGFGLLESGSVSMKNEANIMVKNIIDVVMGGFTYWLFGYGLSFGESSIANPLFGWGDFALNADEKEMGFVYTQFFFQLSFATTSTTIVSGAVAERFNLVAYVFFSAMNTLVYCIPAGWIWGSHGFLYKLGVIDIAGSCAVHVCGGTSALMAAYMVGPRLGRYDDGDGPLPLGSPTSCLLGMFMLWWGWLGFNCGSIFGVQTHKWKYAAKTAVTTLQATIGGGLVTMTVSWIRNNRIMKIPDVVNGIMGSLVSVAAGCALYESWESLVVGVVGGLLAIFFIPLINKLHIDDPVGAVAVHGVCGIWGMLAIGLFVKNDKLLKLTRGRKGLFRGGGLYIFGVQFLACISTMVWSSIMTFTILKIINKYITPIRMPEWEELLGADFVEHGIRRPGVGVSRAVSVLGLEFGSKDFSDIATLGDNPCHQSILRRIKDLDSRRPSSSTRAVQLVMQKVNEYRNPSIVINGQLYSEEERQNQIKRRSKFSSSVSPFDRKTSDNDGVFVTDLEE